MSFEVGQKVVYVGRGNGWHIPENIYTVGGLNNCKCTPLIHTVEVPTIPDYVNAVECGSCNTTFTDRVWWVNSKYFVPLQDISDQESFLQAVKKQLQVASPKTIELEPVL